jgi:biotin carboxyl carrier protein
MAYIANIDDKKFVVQVEEQGRGFKVSLDGKSVEAEIVDQVGIRKLPAHLCMVVENTPYDIVIESESAITVNGESFRVLVEDEKLQKLGQLRREVAHAGEMTITVPMPGLVVNVEVKEGDKVTAHQGLVVVEAMKMQNEIKAPKDGVVKKVMVKNGMTVNGGDTLLVIE